MDNCYILIHQGIADLFNSLGIINYYSNIYKNVFILLNNDFFNNFKIMNEIFINKINVKPIIVELLDYEFITDSNINETCICCHTKWNIEKCPRFNNTKCKYINYKNYEGDIIKIGSFNDIVKWNSFLITQNCFANAFYTFNNLDYLIRFNYFELFNDTNKEDIIYNNFIEKYGNEYILIHEDINRNLLINKKMIINKNLPIINLNMISEYMVDYLKVIQNSKEIHLIDSSWAVFIYLLSYKIIKDIPVFLNETYFKNIGRDINIYKNPIFNNWLFY